MKPVKILIVSDTHGQTRLFSEALRRQRGVDAVFFLGDGISDCEFVSQSEIGVGKGWFTVRGNCDLSSTFLGEPVEKTLTLNLEGKKIVLTHGDLYGVKYHNMGLKKLALDTGADIVLYGHTHIRKEEYADGVYYVNPGSLYGGGNGRSCAVLTLDRGEVLFSFMTFD